MRFMQQILQPFCSYIKKIYFNIKLDYLIFLIIDISDVNFLHLCAFCEKFQKS